MILTTEPDTGGTSKRAAFKNWITFPMPWWYMVFVVPVMWWSMPFFKGRPWITPNHITVISFLVALVAAGLILLDMWWCYLLAGILVHASYSLDCIDGMVARMNSMTSKWGAFLDLYLDRWKLLAYTLSLLWVSQVNHYDIITTILIVLNLGLAGFNVFMSFAVRELIGAARWSEGKVGEAIKSGGYLGRWMAYTDRVGIRPTIGDIEADMAAFCVGLIVTSLMGWEWIRAFLIVSILIHLGPLQMGHLYFAWRYLPRETSPKE
ncbi:MAG: CDP-alcohol phosphatidyltransferase family protein [Pseudomonadota bacterium]